MYYDRKHVTYEHVETHLVDMCVAASENLRGKQKKKSLSLEYMLQSQTSWWVLRKDEVHNINNMSRDKKNRRDMK